MDKIKITGGAVLKGEIPISGAKNAALPLMTATILTGDLVTLKNVPQLADIKTLKSLLETFGSEIQFSGNEMRVQLKDIKSSHADYELVRKMRASIFVLGPLLARNHEAEVSLPGGCAIGSRPVDLHLSAMEALGAEINIENGYIKAKAPKGLIGGEIMFAKVSVGATENALMAATLAKGKTVIRNAAREPEVTDLAEMLNKMGAKISGIGTDTLTIEGVSSLHGCEHSVAPDRIETGSYAVAGLITKGEVTLTNTRADFLQSFWVKLREAGADVGISEDQTRVHLRLKKELQAVDVMTEPYPGYPTDLQAQIMTMNTVARGAGMITETIFENRFMHVPELCRLGADITVHGSSALVRGVEKLHGAQVMATDLRASMALVMAGLVAEGETVVNRVYHLDRGYENLEGKLKACGAQIERLKETE